MEFSAVNRRRPSRETPLGPGTKKDGCDRRLKKVQKDYKIFKPTMHDVLSTGTNIVKI